MTPPLIAEIIDFLRHAEKAAFVSIPVKEITLSEEGYRQLIYEAYQMESVNPYASKNFNAEGKLELTIMGVKMLKGER